MSIAHQELFDELFARFKKAVSTIECKAENFMDFLVIAMEEAEKFSKDIKDKVVLHGLEKKELVEDCLNKFFDEVKEWAQDRKEDWGKLQVELDTLMDKVIDILVQAARGVLDLGERVKDNCSVCCFKKTGAKGAKGAKSAKGTKGHRHAPKDVTDVTALTDKIHEEVKASIVNKKFGANNFVVLVTIVMQVVEKLGNLNGPEKKKVVISVISRLIMEIPMPEGDRDAIKIVVDTTLSKTIDYIIMAANGELDFGAIAEQFKKIFNCC